MRLVTLAEGEVNELHVGLKSTMNALFVKDLAAKTHRGIRGRVEKGKVSVRTIIDDALFAFFWWSPEGSGASAVG